MPFLKTQPLAASLPISEANVTNLTSDLGLKATKIGTPVVRGPFSFAFDTPNLTTGVAFYTPTIGDLLLEVWTDIPTPWDGTTPKWDIFGSAVGATDGVFKHTINNVNSAKLDARFTWGSLAANGGLQLSTVGPVIFLTADPLKLVISQTGQVGGASPGATTGSGSLHIVTATPVAF